MWATKKNIFQFGIKVSLKPEICCGPYEKSLLKHLLFDYEQQSRWLFITQTKRIFILHFIWINTELYSISDHGFGSYKDSSGVGFYLYQKCILSKLYIISDHEIVFSWFYPLGILSYHNFILSVIMGLCYQNLIFSEFYLINVIRILSCGNLISDDGFCWSGQF